MTFVSSGMSLAGSRQVQSMSWEDPLEKGMENHFCILAWKIPWTEEPGRLQSMACCFILLIDFYIYSNQGGPIESKLKESEVRQVTIHAWLSQHKLCGTSCSEDQMQYCPGK